MLYVFVFGTKQFIFDWSIIKSWNFDWLISYDVYMSDNIKVARLILSGEEAVLSEGFVFLLWGLYGSIWKSCYYLEILLVHGLLINCSYYFLYPDHAITPYSTENTLVGRSTEIIQTGWERRTSSCTHPTNYNAENTIHRKV